MTFPRNLGNFADNVNTNGKVEVTGINATGTPLSTTALLGDGTWGTVTTSPAGSTGQVQYNNDGAFGAISSGTSGQVLTSAGAGAAPTWANAAGGAWNYIGSIDLTSASAADITDLDSTYDNYVILLERIQVTANSFLCCRFSSDNGAIYETNSYYSVNLTILSTTANVNSPGPIDSYRITNPSYLLGSGGSFSGVLRLMKNNTASPASDLMDHEVWYSQGSSVLRKAMGAGRIEATAFKINALRLYLDGASFASGQVSIYGIAK